MLPHYISLKENKDKRGSLVPVEENKDIPFKIKRVFWIFGVPENESRANHLSKESNEVLIATNGSCKIKIITKERKELFFELNRKDTALFIPKGYWHSIYDFSPDSTLLVLADTYFNPEDNENDYSSMQT